MAKEYTNDPILAAMSKVASGLQFTDSSLTLTGDIKDDPIALTVNQIHETVKSTIETTGIDRPITGAVGLAVPTLQTPPMQFATQPIMGVTGYRAGEGDGKMQMQFTELQTQTPAGMFGSAIAGSGIVQPVQLGGTITQHPEKQGFERGVTAAGFPTQEQMTGLGFRQGAASYKPQKYQEGVTGEGVQQEVPPQQEKLLPQQNVEAPPQSTEGQQMAALNQREGLSIQPEEIVEPQAQPEEQAADDVQKTVPEGSFVLNYKAVNLAGEDYIRKIIGDAMKIAARKGVDVKSTKGSSGKEAIDILISNGEVIIPPELVRIIGEKQLKLINDKGIAAMKEEEQQQQTVAYGGFIDRKKGYATGEKVRQNKQPLVEQISEQPDTTEEFGIPLGTAEWEKRALNPKTPTTPSNETVRTVSQEYNGKTILFPTIRIVDGKLTSDFNARKEAIQNNDFYVFNSPKEADKYSLELSDRIGLSREQKQQVQ
jgi:hypothetical protein